MADRLADEGVFANVVTALFLAVGVLGVLHHELWRDEMHAWLLARDSSSLSDVFQVTRYEAHFALWRVILYGLTRWTHNPVAMQFLSLLVAAGTVWIVARFSPFRKWERLLFSFGYFPLFEYCIIAQDYNLIVALMFCFCALYRGRTKGYLGLSLVLSLMANTVPYGLAMALVFTALLVVDWFFSKEKRPSREVRPGNLWASGVILLGGYAIAVAQLALMKESPSTIWKPTLGVAGLADAIANLWSAYVPIPKGFPNWMDLGWGTNFLLEGPLKAKGLAVGLAIVCFVISVGLLLGRPSALFLYIVGVSVLLGVQFAVSIGALRHTGFLFLLFVASLWIWEESGTWELSEGPGKLSGLGDFFGRWRRRFVVGLLVIHLAAGIDIFGADWVYPFSGSRPAAQFIRDHGLSDLVIVGSEETRVAALSGYLDRPIFYPDSFRFGSYIDYSKPINKVTVDEVIQEAWEFAQRTHRGVVLVLSRPIILIGEDGLRTSLMEARVCADGALSPLSKPCVSPHGRIERLTHFRGAVDEDFYIYLLQQE